MSIRVSFWQDILEATGGEPILGVVIRDSEHYEGPDADDPRAVPLDCANVVLTADIASSLLDYRYDAGFGGADCHPIYAWTDNRVIFVGEYDGATSVVWLPRHPVDCRPVMA